MTASQLDEIEAGVGFPLPPEYRRVASEFPFRPIGRDRVYWFYADPGRVIGETRATVSEAGRDRTGWRDGYLAIGDSAAGDAYVLDTRAEGLPVHCLSHETNEVELGEWPSFRAFVAGWLAAPEEVARKIAAAAAASAAQWAIMRRGLLITATIPLACLAFLSGLCFLNFGHLPLLGKLLACLAVPLVLGLLVIILKRLAVR